MTTQRASYARVCSSSGARYAALLSSAAVYSLRPGGPLKLMLPKGSDEKMMSIDLRWPEGRNAGILHLCDTANKDKAHYCKDDTMRISKLWILLASEP